MMAEITTDSSLIEKKKNFYDIMSRLGHWNSGIEISDSCGISIYTYALEKLLARVTKEMDEYKEMYTTITNDHDRYYDGIMFDEVYNMPEEVTIIERRIRSLRPYTDGEQKTLDLIRDKNNEQV